MQPRAAVSASLGDDLHAAGVAALASVVLMVAPSAAYAKGGGHGGGHSSHSSSHHSSSSRRTLHPYNGPSRPASRKSSRGSSSSSRLLNSGYTSRHSSSVSSSPQPPVVLYPDEGQARRENGYFCPANLPKPGEKVDVAGDVFGDMVLPKRTATVISSHPASQASLYGAGGGETLQPVPGFESDCSVTVQFDDGTTGTVSAAEQPKSIIEKVAPALLLGTYAATFFIPEGSSWESAESRHEELLRELELASTDEPPSSGEYWGSSEESDEGHQAVRATINFRSDGPVTGRGKDGVDGAYRITRGRWGALDGSTKPTVACIEEYDEGFRVAVEGRYDVRAGKIKARFVSSRGVSGSFELAPKPSVF